jgi:O-antigen/teichoic acid export membrane protein
MPQNGKSRCDVLAAPLPMIGTPGSLLQRNVAWALTGNLGYTACQWGVLVCIAKVGSAEDVGRFALGLALTAPIVTLANLHLRVLEATITTTLALAAIAALASGLGYHGVTLHLVLAVALAKAFEAISEIPFGLLQRAENLRRIAASMLAKGVLSVLAVCLVLRLTGNLVTATLVMALCWGGLLLLYDLPAAARLARLRLSVDVREISRLALLALPLGCVAGIASLTANVPRYAIEASLGPVGLGHFAALAYLLVAANQPVLALAAAVNPRLARHVVSNVAAYRRLTLYTMAIAAGIGFLAIVTSVVCGRWLLTVAYAPEYAEELPALVWLAVAASVGFVSSVLGYAVTAARRLPEQFPIAALSLAVCAAASHFLVPRYGLLGAAWALLATESTRFVCLAVVYAAPVPSRTAGEGRTSVVQAGPEDLRIAG